MPLRLAVMVYRVVPLGVTSFMKASLKNDVRLVACPPCGHRHPWFLLCHQLLVEFVTCLCVLIVLALVCPIAPDLAVVV
jgi:hypothetical protein